MRKLSTLLVVVLVTGLVAGMATVVYAGNGKTTEASANASFGVGGNLSLKITDGSSVWFGEDLEAGEKHEEKNATTLKVKSNIGVEWEITTSKSVTAAPDNMATVVKEELTVALSDTTGTGTKGGIKASYTLEDLQFNYNGKTYDFPKGFYQMEVTYTVAAS